MSNSLEQIITFDDDSADYSTGHDKNLVLPDAPSPDPEPNPDPVDDTSAEPTPDPTPAPDPEPVVAEVEPDDPEPDNTQIKAYYEFLVENNLLRPDEGFEFDDSPEKLEEAFVQTKENLRKEVAKQMFDALPEDFKPIIQYGFSGGKNVKEFLDTYLQAPPDVEDIDLNDIDNQRAVVREYYKHTTRLTPEKTEKLIDSLAERGDLESEAYDAAIALKDIQKTQKQALIEQATLQAEAQREAEIQTRNELLSTIDSAEFIPKDRKNKVKGFMFSETNSQPKMDVMMNSIFSNKEHVVQLADLILDCYDPKKGFTLEDRFTKKATSKALNDFRSKMQDKFSDPKTKTKGGSTVALDTPAQQGFGFMFQDFD